MHIEFYTTVATIIPILFLAVSIQSPDFIQSITVNKKSHINSNIYANGMILILLSLAMSEGLSLMAIYKLADTNYLVPLSHTGAIEPGTTWY